MCGDFERPDCSLMILMVERRSSCTLNVFNGALRWFYFIVG